MKPAALLLAMTLTGCTTLSDARPIGGQWGGRHVGLDMDQANGRLDYDCAAGTIDGPLVSDRAGRFSADGRHMPGTGGPVRIGVTPPSFPAHYSGSVHGDTMTLVVDVPEMGVRIGPHVLRLNAPPVLTRCL